MFKERIPVKLEIKCPANTKLIPMEGNSAHGGHEKEFLLIRNAAFKVLSKNEITDKSEINRIMSSFYGKDYSQLFLYSLEFIRYA